MDQANILNSILDRLAGTEQGRYLVARQAASRRLRHHNTAIYTNTKISQNNTNSSSHTFTLSLIDVNCLLHLNHDQGQQNLSVMQLIRRAPDHIYLDVHTVLQISRPTPDHPSCLSRGIPVPNECLPLHSQKYKNQSRLETPGPFTVMAISSPF